MKALNLFLLFCLIFSVDAFAQTPKAIEADLIKAFKNISPNGQDNTAANAIFSKKLQSYTAKYPATIAHPFDLLKKEHLDVLTSSDGLFRIYSWDTWTGGTMHFFESVFQYKVGAKTYALLDTPKREGDSKPNYHNLYTFNNNGKTFYLGIYRSIGSSKDVGAGIHIFAIENGKLKDAKIIKTNSGLHDELSYGYDFFSVVDIAFDKRPDIKFDNTSKSIYLPIVNAKGAVTNKFITYKFTGQYFEKVKN